MDAMKNTLTDAWPQPGNLLTSSRACYFALSKGAFKVSLDTVNGIKAVFVLTLMVLK